MGRGQNMYDFELKKDENIIEVFEDILICQENNEKKNNGCSYK